MVPAAQPLAEVKKNHDVLTPCDCRGISTAHATHRHIQRAERVGYQLQRYVRSNIRKDRDDARRAVHMQSFMACNMIQKCAVLPALLDTARTCTRDGNCGIATAHFNRSSRLDLQGQKVINNQIWTAFSACNNNIHCGHLSGAELPGASFAFTHTLGKCSDRSNTRGSAAIDSHGNMRDQSWTVRAGNNNIDCGHLSGAERLASCSALAHTLQQ